MIYKKARFSRWIIIISILLLAFLIVYYIREERISISQHIMLGQEHAEKASTLLVSHIEGILAASDIGLKRVIERYEVHLLLGKNSPSSMTNFLRAWVQESPYLQGIAIINREGVVETAAYTPDSPLCLQAGTEVKERPYVTLHRKAPSGVSRLIMGVNLSLICKEMLWVSRPLLLLDTSFGGVVVATFPIMQIKELFDAVTPGSNTQMSIIHDDGMVLWESTPTSPEQLLSIRQIIQNKLQVNKEEKSHLTLDSAPSFQIRYFQHSQQFPFTLVLTFPQDDILQDWYKDQQRHRFFLGAVSFLLLMIAGLAGLTEWQLQKMRVSETEAVNARRATTEFLVRMSHELRTPLNAIIGFAQMLTARYFGPLNEKQAERIQDISTCSTQLLDLISDILDFAKGETGKLTLQEGPIHIESIMKHILPALLHRAEENGVAIHCDFSQLYLLPNLYGDERKVQQIVTNLLSNAIKFTPPSGEVIISWEHNLIGELVLTIRDTGIGIAENDIAKALSMFEQVPNHLSQEGTGLGLPLSKMFVELHGGRLSLSSKEHEGTRVVVTFPKERVGIHS